MVLITLSSGCISLEDLLDVLGSDDSTTFFTGLNNDNGTYSAYGVSFNCHDDWSVGILEENGKNSIAACKIQTINESTPTQIGLFGCETTNISSSPASPQFMVDIIPNTGMSEQEAINQAKNDLPKDYQQISSNIITIDGNKAHQSLIAVNDIIGKIRLEKVYFIKNGKTYLITFSAADKDFDEEKQNFDIILNSFTVD